MKLFCAGKRLAFVFIGFVAGGFITAGGGSAFSAEKGAISYEQVQEDAKQAEDARRKGWVIKETDVLLKVPIQAKNLSPEVSKVCASCKVKPDNYITLPGTTVKSYFEKTQQACLDVVPRLGAEGTLSLTFHWGPDGMPLTPDGASAPFTYTCDLLLENKEGSVSDPSKGGAAWSRADNKQPKNLNSRGRF
jgi:hypothetical protein